MFKDIENEEDEDYELEKMAAVIKAKGGKMYRENLDDDEDSTKNLNGKKPNINIKTNQKEEDDDETTDSDSDSDYEMSETEDQSAAIPINEWDDTPVLTAAGKKNN